MSVYKSMYRMIFAFIVFPFLLFSLLITNIYSFKLEKVITESLQVVAEAQIAEMTNFCERQKEYLTLIGDMDISRNAMRGNLNGEISGFLDNILYSRVQTQSSYIKTLVIIDKNYGIVANSGEYKEYADEGVHFVVQGMKGEPFYISDVLTDENGNKTLVAIAKIEDGRELLGYVMAEISMDFYGNIREQAKLWNESSFYLLDGRQQIISAGTPGENRNSFVTTPREREDYLAQKPVYLVLAVFVIFLCILLSIWLGRFASVRIILPIRCISDTLKAIRTQQDYSLRIKIRQRDELGTLAEEINELIDFIETEDMYKQHQQRLLKEKAEQDALTKVLNKERISQYLKEAIERCRQDKAALAVLFVDVDNFKDFNTNYGHSVGDQVLLFLTAALNRITGGTTGRVGGDEFLVIIEDAGQIERLEECLKLVEEISGSQFVVRGSGQPHPVYCSIGAVRLYFGGAATDSMTAQQVTDMADKAMYEAKDKGKKGYVIQDIR